MFFKRMQFFKDQQLGLFKRIIFGLGFIPLLLAGATNLKAFELTLTEEIEWRAVNKTNIHNNLLHCLRCDLDDNDLPQFQLKVKIPYSGIPKVQVTATETLPANGAFKAQSEYLNDGLHPRVKVVYERKKPYALISFNPLIQSAGGSQLVKSINVHLEVSPEKSSKKYQRNYSTNSVLNQADFYKISVREEGIHKIDRTLLETLGMNTSDFEFSDLRLYGNAAGMLNELAGSVKVDDLVELPVQVYDLNANNRFDGEDYVLFFGESPHQWRYQEGSESYSYENNHYTESNYYFLTTGLGGGKRISQVSANPSFDIELSDYDGLYAIEEDEVNFLKSGREWVGESFSRGSTKSFSFQIPNLVSSEALQLSSSFVARSIQGSSQFEVREGGDLLQNHSFSRVGPDYEDQHANSSLRASSFTHASEQLNLDVTFNSAGNDAIGWLNYLLLRAKQQLNFNNQSLQEGQLVFRNGLALSHVARFNFNSLIENLQIWNVNNPSEAFQVEFRNDGNQKYFSCTTNRSGKFIAFDNTEHLQPQAIGKIERQNLHKEEFPDYIIVYHARFADQASELAEFHSNNGLNVKLAEIEEVYNEFAAGRPDPTAIRDYVKMYYDRAGNDESKMPRYLLLFGDASYDFKNIRYPENENTNLIPTFQSYQYLDPKDSFCTDDYFGFLDDNEGADMSDNFPIDIGVGRLPVHTVEQAQNVINKIKHYKSQQGWGDWLTKMLLIADDEDTNLHFNDSERHADNISSREPTYNVDKLYLDAFPQESTAAGHRYPKVEEAINNKLFTGTFIFNYVGHGGPGGLSHERVISTNKVRNWNNLDKLPLFVTATCSFSKYDDPDEISAGEWVLLNPNGGGIALVTTVRLVFAGSNYSINRAFLDHFFDRKAGEPLTLGEMTQFAKNNSNTGINNRKFCLLGDPALRLNFPEHRVVSTQISSEGNDATGELRDTLKALSRIAISGEVVDANGVKLEHFNGKVFASIYDKPVMNKTLGQDEKSLVAEYELQNSVIFKGVGQVTNGQFSFEFIVPKDINYQFGKGKISFYAESNSAAAIGYDGDVVIGGINDEAGTDETGPEITLYLNNEDFVFGGLTNENPVLLAKLFDENGINTVGNSIGHDLKLTLDEDNSGIVLNQYYESEVGDFTRGVIEYPLSDLEPGKHHLRVKAWDVYNNSGEAYTEFVVAETAKLALENVLNYPNPFTDQTSFWFEHNRSGDELDIRIQIFTVSGKLVKSLNSIRTAEGFRVHDLMWDGRDDFGNEIGRGVYVYQVKVTGSDGSSDEVLQKLVLLK